VAEQEALKTENRILRAKLNLAIEQRDRFMKQLHEIRRIPHAERYEILTDYDQDLEKLNESNT
jgi:hypothetical protein